MHAFELYIKGDFLYNIHFKLWNHSNSVEASLDYILFPIELTHSLYLGNPKYIMKIITIVI